MRLRDFYLDKVVPEARNLNNPAQAKQSGAQCGVESLPHLLRACRRYATILLQKIEEMTLYILQLEERLQQLENGKGEVK